MGSGNAIWVLVTPPMLWSHFTYHIYSIYRISSARHIHSSLMFFATSQLRRLSSTDHMDYGHVSSECVWSQSTHIDEQRQANTHSGPMTTGLRPHIRAAFSWAHMRRRATRPWVPAPTSCAGSVRSQDHAGNAHTNRACGSNRPHNSGVRL